MIIIFRYHIIKVPEQYFRTTLNKNQLFFYKNDSGQTCYFSS